MGIVIREFEIIKNPMPCDSEEYVKATLEINKKMRKVERECRSRHALSVMSVMNRIPMNK